MPWPQLMGGEAVAVPIARGKLKSFIKGLVVRCHAHDTVTATCLRIALKATAAVDQQQHDQHVNLIFASPFARATVVRGDVRLLPIIDRASAYTLKPPHAHAHAHARTCPHTHRPKHG
jgi:hypothetical protein